MSAKPMELEEAAAPLFDVVVKVPTGTRLEDVDRMARGVAGIPADRVEKLINALRSVPQAKIGAGVTRDRADKAEEQFTKAGLIVEITPVLSVQTMVTGSFDGMEVCPACKTRSKMPANRQCPSCGVYIDKVGSDEAQLRRKIMEQERAKLEFQNSRDSKEVDKLTREQLEAKLRAEVRAELEAKMGIKKDGLLGGKAGILKLAGVAALLAVAFVGGRGFTPSGWSWSHATGADKSAKGEANVDKMLSSAAPAGGPAAAAGVAAGAAAGAADAGLTGDPDIDDPLIQAAGGKRIGAKGLTMEQAVAASQALAKSVGNTTGQRGGGGMAPGAVGGAAGGAGGADAVAAGAEAGGAAGGAASTGGAAAAGVEIPATVKLELSLEFARKLAEMGQVARAVGVLNAVKASPAATSPAGAAAARLTELEIRAFALRGPGVGDVGAGASALLAQAVALPEPADRAQALSRLGTILSRNERLPQEASRAFLTQAAEALKAISGSGARVSASSDWAVALGESMLADALARARSGAWSKAGAVDAQLASLLGSAPDARAQAQLHAIDAQLKLQLGEADKATRSIQAGLAQAKSGSLPERAALLRAMARLSGGAGGEAMLAAQNALQAQATAKSGLERAQTLVQLSLLNGEAGLRGKAAELAKLAQATGGLSPADAVQLSTDLLVRGDLAAARVMHSVGLYAESETVIRRVGDYLL